MLIKKYGWLLLLAIGFITPSFTYQPAATNTFETQLNTLIAGFPHNFEKLKGPKGNVSKDDTAMYDWKCLVQLEGATETYIAKNYPTDKHLSVMARYESSEKKEDAETQYKALVAKVKACKFKCGEMVITEGKDASKIFTDWTVKPSGKATAPYADMVFRVKMVDHNYGNSFHFYSVGIIIFKK